MNLIYFSNHQYIKYSKVVGSEYIASEFALLKILELIRKYKLKRILEIGVGIGTISGSILKYAELTSSTLKCTGTENNDFCLAVLPGNLEKLYNEISIYSDFSKLPKDQNFDLIIVDGKEALLKDISSSCSENAIVVIEGDRSDQVEVVKSIFPNSRFAPMVSILKNGKYSKKDPSEFRGGIKLIFTNPTTFQYLHWMLIKGKMKVKYLKRDYFS
ncbi:hypothetical protein BC962_2822 [Gillisia mitskevichiae]|uniref:Methyltransferase family protein n=1 Tax=Gillisia mitskevichiae TaxID=270921 RepID=A0A495P5B3_9FLAO|nr:hypothetical protein [Gillisia mitskevichiae]RKS45146.1 hypothetical protein BC962_2822 [Gillisia mitskevichiae]